MNSFEEKLKDFIVLSQGNSSPREIKDGYLKMVKEFHPDTNNKIDFSTANENMVKLNYAYSRIIGKETIINKAEDKYEKNMENGKYWFINFYGKKEYVNEKALFIYKLALLEVEKSQRIMLNYPVFAGKKEESGYVVIRHLYHSFLLAKQAIELDRNGMYGNMARELLKKVYKTNKIITNGLKTRSNETGLIIKSKDKQDADIPDEEHELCYRGCPEYLYTRQHNCRYIKKLRRF
jgi:hypothetical protein